MIVDGKIIKELNKKCEDLIALNRDFKEIKTLLSDYEQTEPAFVFCVYAYYFSKKGDYYKALENIQTSINSLSDKTPTLNLFLGDLIVNIYSTAGVIYANIDDDITACYWFHKYVLFKISKVQTPKVPNTLLSFRRYNEYSLSDLINEEITLCDPQVLNDPYDSLLIKWAEHFNSESNKTKHLKSYAQALMQFRIRSFTCEENEDKDHMIQNTLMWSHYADDHKGYCVKYHFSDNFNNLNGEDRFMRFTKINYHNQQEPVNIDTDTISIPLGLATKESHWSYENEVRLIYYQNQPYDGSFTQISLDEEAYIDSIYFGCRCSDKNIHTIMKVLAKNKSIKYFKMKADYKNIYTLIPEEIAK